MTDDTKRVNEEVDRIIDEMTSRNFISLPNAADQIRMKRGTFINIIREIVLLRDNDKAQQEPMKILDSIMNRNINLQSIEINGGTAEVTNPDGTSSIKKIKCLHIEFEKE